MATLTNTFLRSNSWIDPSADEKALVAQLIGKIPQGDFSIAVRKKSGEPVVIENAPFFYDGTPMPTRFWLVDSQLVSKISKLESVGGVKKVQEEIDFEIIQEIHVRAESERSKLIDKNYQGPKPSGGVGGTRKGVKCLHTHVANFLATGEDEVGEWTLERIEQDG